MLETITDTFLNSVHDGDTYLFLLPIYSVLLGGEWIVHHLRTRRAWDYRDATANVTITVAHLALSVLIGHLLPVALIALLFEHARLFTIGTGPGAWLLAFLLYDLAWYVDHRIGHRTGLFWSMHHVHHSSTEYNMTVASRGFLFDNTLLPRPTFYLLPILGLSAFHVVVVIIITNIWGIAQHTRLVGRLGRLDWLLATPSSHRVHHGVEPKYIDRNYGEVLMIWDHLFGTYQAEEEEPTYGVTTPIETYNPVRIEVAGLRWLRAKIRKQKRPSDKLRCLVRPPEWSSDSATGA